MKKIYKKLKKSCLMNKKELRRIFKDSTSGKDKPAMAIINGVIYVRRAP